MNKEEKIKLIQQSLNRIRPYINRDGGDVEFVDINETGIVHVRMLGACVSCNSLDDTLYEGIEAILIDEVPGVIGVYLVE
ncbi:MAG: NifU family protein [Anaerorhabdus sp.]